jgi:D-amino peptidase
MKKIYVMTDLEGVAGVQNFEDWCFADGKYYELAKEFLTMEVNAAVGGLFEGGAKEILVSDGHGAGAINPKLLSPKVGLLRGWPNGWPLELDRSFDGLIFVGQHPKAGTPRGHLCHTQSLHYIDLSVNGVSIGEFGQLAMCASELSVRTIFGAGDEEFTKEARALVPGIETVAVKKGLQRGTGEDLDEKAYTRFYTGAIHVHPERSRKAIHDGAKRAIMRAKRDKKFGIIPLKSPFDRVIMLRPNRDSAVKRVSRVSHPSSVIAMMNLPNEPRPLNGE